MDLKPISTNGKWAFWLVCLMGAFLLVPQFSASAQAPSTCPALVEQALSQINSNCASLERNSGCYGHNQVFATFAADLPADAFSQPGNRVALSTLRSIQTSAFDLAGQRWGAALMNIQANLPNMLPGQGVVLLLLGDVAVENAVAPDQIVQPGSGTEVVTRATAHLRSGPGLDSNVIATVEAGTTLLADSVDQTHNWLRVIYEDVVMWVGAGTVVPGTNVDTLPVLTPERQTPMQAFQMRTGLGGVACNEAPSVLAVQSPENLTVSLTLNGVDIQIGSLITLQSLTASQMRLTVHHGMVEMNDGTLVMPDETLVAQLNADGTIMDWAPPRPATPTEQAIGAQVQTILDNLNNPLPSQPPPANWTIGQLLEVVNANGAWQRQTPDSTSTVIVTVLPDRTPVVVSGGPQWDGVQWWWQVRTEDGLSDGWVEQSQLGERAVLPPSTCAPRTDWPFTYTVQPGDTLFAIAQRAGVSLTELQTANCISDPSAISVGQVLRVPQPVQGPPPAGSSDNVPQEPPPAKTEEVQDGGQSPNPQQPLPVVTLPAFELINPVILPTATPRVILR